MASDLTTSDITVHITPAPGRRFCKTNFILSRSADLTPKLVEGPALSLPKGPIASDRLTRVQVPFAA